MFLVWNPNIFQRFLEVGTKIQNKKGKRGFNPSSRNTDKEDLKLMERRSYVIKGFPFIGYEVITVIVTKQIQREYKGSPIQIPVTKDNAKSTNHKGNVINVLRQIYKKPVSLTDIGIYH